MKINIENYRNISKLELEVEEQKVNHIFGISGSGKSSIASALTTETDEEDVKINKTIEDLKIEVNGTVVDKSNYSLFDLESAKNILITQKDDGTIYDILFSNNDELKRTQQIYEESLNEFEELKHKLYEYKNNVDLMIKHFDVKINKDKSWAKNSKFVKLQNDLKNSKNSRYLKEIKEFGINYMEWLKEGKEYKRNNQCPYCNKLMPLKREGFIESILALTPKNFELITKDNNYLENIGIEKPVYTRQSSINKVKKEIVEAVDFKKEIEEIIYLFEEYKNSNLDISRVKAIKISSKFQKVFPDMEEYIISINNKLKKIKKNLGNIKRSTDKLLSKNTKKINDYLGQFGIPYTFIAKEYDETSKSATYCLYHNKDTQKKDRIKKLSFGEKNIVSLILFLLSHKENTLIIDDPASSYDEYRREKMFRMIYDLGKGKTIILLSHDQVFIKFAILYKYYMNNKKGLNEIKKYIKENTGAILYYSNYTGNAIVKEISKEDFASLDCQIIEFIKSKSLSYYRKIINIRLLSELRKDANKKIKDIYSYTSAILHCKPREEIYTLMEKENILEEEIIQNIKDIFGIVLETIPNDYFSDFSVEELSNFEKVFYYREKINDKSLDSEFSNIIHLNERLFISLNPYKFDYFSPNVYKLIDEYSNNENNI